MDKKYIKKTSNLKSEKIRKSVRNLYGLLKEGLDGGKIALKILEPACESQGALASLNLPGREIQSVSINTLKTVANEVIELGGWQEIDKLRRKIKSNNKKININHTNRKNKKIINEKKVNNDLRERLENSTRHRIELNLAYFELLNIVNKMAEKNTVVEKILNKHLVLFQIPPIRKIIEDDLRDE